MLIGSYYFEMPTVFPELSVTSLYFVIFCLIVFALSWPLKSALRTYVLLVANCIFIWSFDKDCFFLLLILLSSVFSYFIGLLLDDNKNRVILGFGITFFLALLSIYKYADILKTENIIIPLGLSFYSFKIVSYLFDVYRGTIKAEKNIIYYFDYVMFFPCITAGPINRAKDFLNEIRNPKPFDYKDVKGGGFQLSLGIFEKMVFCDYIAQIVERSLGNSEIIGLNVLFGILLYSFQIYLDFDAASNIAIGGARLLGFHLPKNFNSPYLAKNLKEFWNRWHISLSSWFKDYLYIPLGGNKKGDTRKFINIIIVFIVSGLWHGSTLNFLLWGLLHGLIRVAEDIVESKYSIFRRNNFVISFFRVIFNFIVISLLWLVFKYQSINEVFAILGRLFVPSSLNFEAIGLTINEKWWLCIVLVIVVLLDLLRNRWDMLFVFNKVFIIFRWAIYALLIVIFLIFGVYGGSFEATDFIYRFF